MELVQIYKKCHKTTIATNFLKICLVFLLKFFPPGSIRIRIRIRSPGHDQQLYAKSVCSYLIHFYFLLSPVCTNRETEHCDPISVPKFPTLFGAESSSTGAERFFMQLQYWLLYCENPLLLVTLFTKKS